jgi:hypothetical protein
MLSKLVKGSNDPASATADRGQATCAWNPRAVATFPESLHLAHVTIIPESILRTADAGERKPVARERIALFGLRLGQRP